MIQPANIVKPGIKISRAGDQIKDWSTPTSVTTSCWVWSKKTEENEGLDDEAILSVVLFFRPGENIKNEDRIETLGHTFTVSGPPKPKYTIKGLHHYEVDAEAEY